MQAKSWLIWREEKKKKVILMSCYCHSPVIHLPIFFLGGAYQLWWFCCCFLLCLLNWIFSSLSHFCNNLNFGNIFGWITHTYTLLVSLDDLIVTLNWKLGNNGTYHSQKHCLKDLMTLLVIPVNSLIFSFLNPYSLRFWVQI